MVPNPNSDKNLREVHVLSVQPKVVKSKRTLYVFGSSSPGITDSAVDLDSYLYETLKETGSMTRAQLVEMTQFARSTLFDALERLIRDGRVRKQSVPRQTRGRPKVLFEAV